MQLLPSLAIDGFLRSVLDASTDCIKVVELDGTLVYLNANGLRALEIDDPTSVCGLGWPELWPPEQGDQVRSAVTRAGAGETVRFTAPCPTAKGTPRWWDVVVAPMRDTMGRIERLVSISRDVTTHKETERVLRLALDAGELATWEWNIRSGAVIWSDRHYSMLGYNRAEVTPSYEAWSARIHPQDRAETERKVRDAIETGIPYRHEFRFQHPDGVVVWCEAQAVVERDDTGSPTRMVGVMQDITERRLATAALRESEERFRALADDVPVVIWVTDATGAATYLNRRWREVTGQNEAEGQGLGWLDAVHPDDKGAAGAAFLAANAAREPLRLEYRLRHADGSYRWALDRASPRVDAAGDFLGYVGCVIDIHERREAEGRVRASEERYRTLFESMDEGYCIVELRFEDGRATDYRFVEVNPAFERHTGLAGAVGRWARDLIPDLEQHWFDAYGRVASTGEPVRFESGSEPMGRYYDVYAFRIGDPGARRVAILFADVSARKSAEARLRELNTSLERRVAQAIAERDRTWNNAQDLLLVLDAEGLIHAANPAWTTILGWTPEELVGCRNLDLVHPDDHVATQHAVATAASGTLPSVDIRCLRNDGSYRRIAWVAAPEGDLIYASGRDVTAEREQAEALARAQEALRQAQRMEALGQLTGGVAHDFNNLLAVITANLELLEGFASGDARMTKAIRNAMRGAERGAALTQRLLAFARKQDLKTEPVDVASLVSGLSDMLQDTVGEGIRIDMLVPDAVPQALVDPNQLELAILNLAVNARDAMPGGGRLRLEIDEVASRGRTDLRDGDYVRIRVTDTGTGMDEATLRRAVEPFFTTKPVGRGTGLGLSMIHGVAVQSGGAFALDSAPDRGTTAEILLPVAHAPGGALNESRESSGVGEASRELLLLVVDDDLAVLEATTAVVGTLGHTALSAVSGEQALALVSACSDLDAVLADVEMPGMGGIELAREIARIRPGMPVILMSGHTDGALNGPHPLLAKPFRRGALAAVLAQVVER